MKKILIVILCLISVSSFASDHTYDVTGADENGHAMEGTIESNNGEIDVSGVLIDEYGNPHDFNGQWEGSGEISGATEEGVSVDLSTN